MPPPVPAIVVPAYNRPACLQRLLQAVAVAHYPHRNEAEVTLVISIDHAAQNESVVQIAQNFIWPFGAKTIIQQAQHLGLKQHILACGRLTQQFGSIILLEDDLLVSPWFYRYAQQALEFYEPDEQIAGISLYHYEIAENGFYPFLPVDDGSDVYFMQIASSWGQTWTARQWHGFEQWLNQNPVFDSQNNQYPDYLKQWSEHSWKKMFIAYLLQSGKYFVFPRLSLTTNTGELGTNTITKGLFQVPLQQAQRMYRFVPFSESKAVYDAFFELLPKSLNQLTNVIEKYDYTVDLYGTKTLQQITTPFVLTTRPVNHAVMYFGQEMVPNVLNIACNISGAAIKLSAATDVVYRETPAFTRYYRLASIAEKVFAPLHNYPKISIVLPFLPQDTAESLLQTVRSLTEQNYPNLEINIVGWNKQNTATAIFNQANAELQHISVVNFFSSPLPDAHLLDLLQTGIQNSSGTIVNYTPKIGIIYQNYVLHMAAQIFSGFGQVNWITGTGANQPQITDNRTSLPQYRWNKKRFASASLQKALQLLQPQNMFWRKFLWNDTGGSFPPDCPNLPHLGLFGKFWERDPLFTVFRPITAGAAASETFPQNLPEQFQQEFANIQQRLKQSQSGWAASVIGLLAKPFYLHDVPYLRYLYISLQHLPPIIRYHVPTNSYYLSQF
ncbi:hypothetical protein C7N43_33745 [Sphingobacteriales bacterium UPWRP_1]|nr:hypothetical protein B6N25_01040 [Sphingobacteriales bacterium TSM_CSS]PSJ72533.1 hypothetical protein C7N43_33745 [Sphingobacteriales bacterium UPWRP_1]